MVYNEKASEIFKLFEVSIVKQIWDLSYRDQKVYFGSDRPPVIKQVEESMKLAFAKRTKTRSSIIANGKEVPEGQSYGKILSLQNFIIKYRTASDEVLNWMRSNAHRITLSELKIFLETHDIARNELFLQRYYQLSNKFEIWDTLYAETVEPGEIIEKQFRERIELTLIISEIMERHETLKDDEKLCKILDQVKFKFPAYLLVEEQLDNHFLLSKLTKAYKILQTELRRQEREIGTIGVLDEVAAKAYNPQSSISY